MKIFTSCFWLYFLYFFFSVHNIYKFSDFEIFFWHQIFLYLQFFSLVKFSPTPNFLILFIRFEKFSQTLNFRNNFSNTKFLILFFQHKIFDTIYSTREIISNTRFLILFFWLGKSSSKINVWYNFPIRKIFWTPKIFYALIQTEKIFSLSPYTKFLQYFSDSIKIWCQRKFSELEKEHKKFWCRRTFSKWKEQKKKFDMERKFSKSE